jgi:hypothetical protein
MNNIVSALYAVSALLGSSALAINAVTKFMAERAKRIAAMHNLQAAQRTPLDLSSLFFFCVAVGCMFMGIGGLICMDLSPDGPATRHEISLAAMCLVNVVVGNLLLSTMTIKKYVA